jgi:pectin methylesterase-like acyl-CoA thioesterase
MLHASTPACVVLKARPQKSDTSRIQEALNVCGPGKAVILEADGSNKSFESAPLILPRGVTLFIDRVTLYASKNPRDYDLSPNSCGAAPVGKAPNCKPFLFSYQAAYSGVAGYGTIDGQGSAWWPKSLPTVPDLVSSYESQGFQISGVTLQNAAGVHAAIFKTIGLRMSGVKIESPDNLAVATGILLSNAIDAEISDCWIHVPGVSMELTGSILGPTANVRVNRTVMLGKGGVAIRDGVNGAMFGGDFVEGAQIGTEHVSWNGGCLAGNGAHCDMPALSTLAKPSFDIDLTSIDRPGTKRSLMVKPGDSIQKAVDALPLTGGDIAIEPGTYREVVTIRKPHVHLHGSDADPSKTIIVFSNGAVKNGGTFNSSTVFVEADDVSIDHLSIVNDLGSGKGQAVALHVTGDRAIFRHLRISAAQDTLFAASHHCYGDYGPCVTARQYFADSFIEGNTDFIFGDSKAVFDHCELHGISTGSVMYTAQSKHTAEQDSGYVFNHCVLTGDARPGGVISLGRPWRPYASVVFLDARIEALIIPAGWTEWLRFGVPSLPTAYYAEFHSTGPGASPATREAYSHQLTDAEAQKWSAKTFLGWDPR